jgi:hypothetical protein
MSRGKAYADAVAQRRQNIKAVINVETIGYTKAKAGERPRQQVKTREGFHQSEDA